MKNLKVLLIIIGLSTILFKTYSSTKTLAGSPDTTTCLNLDVSISFRIKSTISTGPYTWEYSITGLGAWGPLPDITNAYKNENSVELEIHSVSVNVSGFYRIVGDTDPGFKVTVINTIPTISPSSGVCTGSSILYSTDPSMSDYNWTVTGGTIGHAAPFSSDENITWNSTAGNGTIQISYNAGSGCTASKTFTIQKTNIPTLTSTLTPSAICSGETFNYTPISSGGTTFSWSRLVNSDITSNPASTTGTNGISQQLTSASDAPTIVTYVYDLNANGCTNSVNVDLVVKPKPTLNNSLPPTPICSEATFDFTPGSSTAGTSFNWTRNANSDITAIPASTAGTGNPNQKLTSSSVNPTTVRYVYSLSADGCTNTTTYNVDLVVNPMPSLSSALNPAAICSSDSFNYIPSSLTVNTIFNWNRVTDPLISSGPSNTSGTDNPKQILANSSSDAKTVRYVYSLSANGCTNSSPFNVDVLVKPMPLLANILPPPSICNKTVFSFAPVSLTTGTSFNWTRDYIPGIVNLSASGTGNPNERLENNTKDPIDVVYLYNLSANGCTNPYSYQVKVKTNPTSHFTSSEDTTICNNSRLYYKAKSSSSAATFSWHRFPVAGILNPEAAANNDSITETLNNASDALKIVPYRIISNVNGCNGDTLLYNVTVYTPITLNITATPATACVGATIGLDGSPNGGSGIYTHKWSAATGIFSPATNSPTPDYKNTVAGNYEINYKVTDDKLCTASGTKILTFSPLPAILHTINSPICEGSTLNFHLSYSGIGEFRWKSLSSTFKSSAKDTILSNVTINDTGKYRIIVTNQYLCKDSVTFPVFVNKLPEVEATAANICAHHPLILIGSSPTATSFNWNGPGHNFNGKIDTVAIAADVSLNNNKYILTATDAKGCSGKDTVQAIVKSLPVPTAINNGPKCEGQSIKLTGSSTGTFKYMWIKPNGSKDSLQNIFSIPKTSNTDSGTYKFIVTDLITSCKDSVTTEVIINKLPLIDLSGVKSIYSEDQLPVDLIGSPLGGSFYGPGVISYNSTFLPKIVGLTDSTAIFYTFTDDKNCTNTGYVKASIIKSNGVFVMKSTYCSNSPMDSIEVNIPGGITGYGKFSTFHGLVDNGKNVAYVFPSQLKTDTVYTVTFTYEKDKLPLTIPGSFKVVKAPVVDFNNLDTAYCYLDDQTYQLTPTNSPGGGESKFSWITSKGDTSHNSVYNFSPKSINQNTYDSIKYQYTNELGCKSNVVTKKFFINPLPDATLGMDTIINFSDGAVEIKAKNHDGGTFSGQGVSNNIFYPGKTGVKNNILINYEYTDNKTGCTSTSSVYFDVLSLTENIEGKFKYCNGQQPETIKITNRGKFNKNDTFIIKGGSGLSIINDTTAIIYPKSIKGTYINGVKRDTIIYKYLISKALFSISQPITVDSISDKLDFKLPSSSYCKDVKAVSINLLQNTKYPSNGICTWVGDTLIEGASDLATLYPYRADTGNHIISFVYKTLNGCAKTVSKTVRVEGLPKLNFENLRENYDYAQKTVVLSASPAGGTFYSPTLPMMSNGVMNLDYMNVRNNNMVSYTYPDPKTKCSNTIYDTINIIKALASIQGIKDTICYTDEPINLSVNIKTSEGYTPIKARFYGRGVNPIDSLAAQFTPSVAEEGYDTIYYTYLHSDNQTEFTISKRIYVDFIPPLKFSDLASDYCIGSENYIYDVSNVAKDGIGGFYLQDHKNYSGYAFSSLLNSATFFTDKLINENLASFEVPETIRFEYQTKYKACKFDTSKIIVIHDKPKVNFEVPDPCISDKKSIDFINHSSIEGSELTYLWNFGDDASTEDTSSLKDPYYNYTKKGEKRITLTATPKFEKCAVTSYKNITIDDKPNASFKWNSECFTKGESIKFTNTSSNLGGLDILSDSTRWIVNNGTPIFGQTLSVKFDQPSNNSIQLIVETSSGCMGIAKTDFHLRQTYFLDSSFYYEGFFKPTSEEWFKNSTNENINSWHYGKSEDTLFTTDLPGQNVWFAKTDTANQEESSWVTGPCLDFTEIEKPMIKLNIWKAFESSANGAVLQYRSSSDTTFRNIGIKDEGINWFNSSSISGAPGGEKEGWTSLTSADTNWVDARFNLDFLKGKKDVQFRIAYGKKYSNSKGFAFKDVWIGDRSKILTLEHFTSNSTFNVETEKTIDNIMSSYSNDFLDIRYHMYPESDELAKNYTAGPDIRINYYKVQSVPYTIVDGGAGSNQKVNYNQVTWNDAVKKSYMQRILNDPEFYFIDFSSEKFANYMKIKLKIKSNISTSAPTSLIVAVVEKEVVSSGIAFKNVLRKLLPTPAGTVIDKWFANDIKEFEFIWDYSDINNATNFKVVAFIQDDASQEIYQAATDDPEFHSGTAVKTLNSNTGSIALYPNPARNEVFVEFNHSLLKDCNLNIYNQLGMLVKTVRVEAGRELIPLNISGIKPGIYLVKVSGGDQVFKTERLVIIK